MSFFFIHSIIQNQTMKKILLPSLFIFCLLFTNLLKAQVSITTGPSNLCINSKGYAALSNTVATATNYSWTVASGSCVATFTPSGNTTNITYPCCGIFTINCAAYNGTTFITTITNTVSVACNVATSPTITSIPNGSLCSGTSATLSAFGCTTYTWIPGSFTGANIVINPNSSTCYTVIATNSLNCTNLASSCMSVIPSYSISVIGNTAICAGNTVSLTLTGGPSFNTMPGNINSSNPVFSPSVTSSYTIACPSGAYPCPSSTVIPIVVYPLPNISISMTGSSTACLGISNTLTATGGGVGYTYTWTTGATNASIIATPTVPTCYTVAGTSSLGCVNLAVQCLSVMALPQITVTGNNTLCLGSSVNLSANGANTYTWNTSPALNTASISLIPTGSFTYMAYGTNANGCINFSTYTVNVNNNCAIVWPGDANRDGQVSSADVLELGLAAGSTGAARSSTSNAWAGQFASAWTGTVSTGWNKVHADCNGDGAISSLDQLAITNNFSLTHAFKESTETAVNADISMVPQLNYIVGNSWNMVDIMLGDASNIQNQIYGITFDLNYDQSMVQTDSVKIIYTSSFLNAANQNYDFGKVIFANGKLYAATVRSNHSNVNGNGKIGELWLKTKSGITENTVFNFGMSNGQKVNAAGITGTLSTSGQSNLNLTNNATGISSYKNLLASVRFYPNPAYNSLVLVNTSNTLTSFQVIDLSGRVILGGEFTSNKTLDVSSINKGIYFVAFENANGKVVKKLVKE